MITEMFSETEILGHKNLIIESFEDFYDTDLITQKIDSIINVTKKENPMITPEQVHELRKRLYPKILDLPDLTSEQCIYEWIDTFDKCDIKLMRTLGYPNIVYFYENARYFKYPDEDIVRDANYIDLYEIFDSEYEVHTLHVVCVIDLIKYSFNENINENIKYILSDENDLLEIIDSVFKESLVLEHMTIENSVEIMQATCDWLNNHPTRYELNESEFHWNELLFIQKQKYYKAINLFSIHPFIVDLENKLSNNENDTFGILSDMSFPKDIQEIITVLNRVLKSKNVSKIITDHSDKPSDIIFSGIKSHIKIIKQKLFDTISKYIYDSVFNGINAAEVKQYRELFSKIQHIDPSMETFSLSTDIRNSLHVIMINFPEFAEDNRYYHVFKFCFIHRER